MSAQMQQRLLWGAGAGIVVLWFLFTATQELGEWISTCLILGVGAAALWLKMLPAPTVAAPINTTTVAREIVEQTFTYIETLIGHLEELAGPEVAAPWHPQLAVTRAGLERQALRVTVLGTQAVGKSTLIEQLNQACLPHLAIPCTLTEIRPLEVGQSETIAAADLVLFVVQGDLTDSEYQCLQALNTHQKRILVVFNKQDQYLPAQRLTLIQKLQQQFQTHGLAADVVAIAAHPQAVKVRRYQTDGSYDEQLELPPPDLAPLLQRLQQIVSVEAEQLILQQTYQKTLTLQAQIQDQLNQVRQQLAQPIIERYQWITGATAFANPFATLDLLAAAAISGKMVMELGSLYRLKFSLSQAQAIATTLAGSMLKLGLVEISTQALSTLLKGHALTFVAGGLLQGMSAAHLTRMAGLSLVEHFQALSTAELTAPETHWNPEQLKQTLTQVFQAHQHLDGLKTFAHQAITRFQGQGALLETR